MTRKRKYKSNLSRATSRARAAKLARIQKSEEHTRIHRVSNVKDRATPRAAAKTLEPTQPVQVVLERHPSSTPAVTIEQIQARIALEAERQIQKLMVRPPRSYIAEISEHQVSSMHSKTPEASKQTQSLQMLYAESQASSIVAETPEKSQTQSEYIIDHRIALFCIHCKARWKKATPCCSGRKASVKNEPDEPIKPNLVHPACRAQAAKVTRTQKRNLKSEQCTETSHVPDAAKTLDLRPKMQAWVQLQRLAKHRPVKHSKAQSATVTSQQVYGAEHQLQGLPKRPEDDTTKEAAETLEQIQAVLQLQRLLKQRSVKQSKAHSAAETSLQTQDSQMLDACDHDALIDYDNRFASQIVDDNCVPDVKPTFDNMTLYNGENCGPDVMPTSDNMTLYKSENCVLDVKPTLDSKALYNDENWVPDLKPTVDTTLLSGK